MGSVLLAWYCFVDRYYKEKAAIRDEFILVCV